MKSISEQFVAELVAHGFMKLAPSSDMATWFTLKTQKRSPIYFDLRSIQSVPSLRKKATHLLAETVKKKGLDAKHFVAVPFGSLGLAYYLAAAVGRDGRSVLTPRPGIKAPELLAYLKALGINVNDALAEKAQALCRIGKAKEHGLGGQIVGLFNPGDTAMPIEDVATSGASISETADQLIANGLTVNTAIVLLDREQGARKNLIARGIELHSVLTQTDMVEKLDKGHLMRNMVLDYLARNTVR
jgi:orotate phosphoribosyltransferase